MEINVTPATLASVLKDNQPDADASRTIGGLVLLAFALTDMAATASLGNGVTAAVSGWLIRSGNWPLGQVVGLLTAVLDGLAFAIGLGMIRGTRWQALFKTSFREMFGRVPFFTEAGSDPMILLAWGLALAVGFMMAGQLYLGGGLQLAMGPAPAAMAAAVMAPAIGLVILGALGTAWLERHRLMTAGATIVLMMLVLSVTTEPLRSALRSAPPTVVAGISGWTTLALGIGVAILLLLGAESSDDVLTLLMSWDPDADPSLRSYFERNREEATLTRRTVLNISTNGRQVLLVTKHVGEKQVRVVQTTALDKVHSIVLNEMGFAILDFRKMAESMNPTRARQAGPNGEVSYSDPDNLVSFDVRIMVQTSTSALPTDLAMAEDTFTFLRDHIFASTVLSPLIDSVIAMTVNELTQREIDGNTLADMRADWGQFYHALDFVDDARAMQSCHVLDRSPGMIQSYRVKQAVGEDLKQKVDAACSNLERLRPRMNAISMTLRSGLEAYVLKEIDNLILRNANLPAEEKRKIRAVVRLFSITATATPTPQRQVELDAMRQQAKETQGKLASDIKEAKAEVIKAQAEVAETIKALLAKSVLSGAERRFLESWRPGSAQPLPQMTPSAAPTTIIAQPAAVSHSAPSVAQTQPATASPTSTRLRF